MLRHDDEEAGAYTLYLEHLGGLVPLLKGRRTSKIRPEFVIFDPQAEGITTNTQTHTHKFSLLIFKITKCVFAQFAQMALRAQ